MRVVADPGVLVSAVISPGGAPAGLLRAWRRGDLELVVSPALLVELRDVLMRDKFRTYVSEADVRRFIADVATHATLYADPPVPVGATADQNDDYLVGLARQTGADAIVSGDRDLLDVANLNPPAISPRTLLERLQRR